MQSNAKLQIRNRITTAIAAALAGAFCTGQAKAVVLFDDVSAFQAGVTGTHIVSTASTPNTFMGDGYTFATRPADGPVVDITGFDLFPGNLSGLNFSGMKIYTYIWGTVNTGTVSATTPAFSNSLGGPYVLTSTGTFNTGYYFSFQPTQPGITPDISQPAPLLVNGSSSIGLTWSIQGTTNGTTYSTYNGASTMITYGAAPTVGSEVFNGYYRNANSETNGNFTSTLRTLGYTYQSLATRIFGDYLYDNWNQSSGGTWNATSSVYSADYEWTNLDVPTAVVDAVFNLSSAAPYVVAVPGQAVCKNLMVENDNVNLNFTTPFSAINVSAGALSVGQPAPGFNSASGTLNITSSAGFSANVSAATVSVGGNGGVGLLTVGNYVRLVSGAAVNIGAGSALNLSAGSVSAGPPNGALVAPNIILAGTANAPTGRLDIGAGSLDLTSASLATITGYVAQGYNGGTWNSAGGITSSAAAADTSHLTAIGVISNNLSGGALYGSNAPLGLFEGANPGLNDVLVKYTYYGDANLDGKVDGTDYSQIDASYFEENSPGGTPVSGWFNGDFNYDGVVNGSDYTLIDNAFNSQGAQFQAAPNAQVAGGAAVPEPAGVGIAAISAIGLLRRNRRR